MRHFFYCAKIPHPAISAMMYHHEDSKLSFRKGPSGVEHCSRVAVYLISPLLSKPNGLTYYGPAHA